VMGTLQRSPPVTSQAAAKCQPPGEAIAVAQGFSFRFSGQAPANSNQLMLFSGNFGTILEKMRGREATCYFAAAGTFRIAEKVLMRGLRRP
jgi:hypothetical protein